MSLTDLCLFADEAELSATIEAMITAHGAENAAWRSFNASYHGSSPDRSVDSVGDFFGPRPPPDTPLGQEVVDAQTPGGSAGPGRPVRSQAISTHNLISRVWL